LFPLFAPGIVDTGGKFAANDVNTGGNLPPVSTLPVIAASMVDRRWKICHRYQTILAELVAKFAAGVVATSDKFATGVGDTGGALDLRISSKNFRKNLK
jgi:hypothetical protein